MWFVGGNTCAVIKLNVGVRLLHRQVVEKGIAVWPHCTGGLTDQMLGLTGS
jgi:hypothetical protein